MAPEIQEVVRSAQAWLQSSWQVQVPFAWLRACVEWLQEEGGGGAPLTQQQINQQALDQWLLTDLRDLGHPVLPGGLSQAQKTELHGTFCVQVDSLLDISLPAYGQLQNWKGTDCANEAVSAVTQMTQRPWEAKPTRMLLLQVTDGIQSLEAMEYQHIPVLDTTLRPGVKLQLQGRMVCRLGVLFLGPANVKLLGGEVEDMVDRNNQGRLLCRALGLPEAEQQQQQQQGGEALSAPQGNEEAEDDDQELLASLEAQEQVEQARGWRAEGGRSLESGYGTLSQTSTTSSRTASLRSEASSRNDASSSSYRSGSVRSNRSGLDHGSHRNNQRDSTMVTSSSTSSPHHEVMDHAMGNEDFLDEDFDDLPLDELDSVFQESTNDTPQSNTSHRNAPQTNNRLAAQHNSSNGPRQHNDGCNQSGRGQLEAVTSKPYSASSSPPPPGARGNHQIMDEDMDSYFPEEIDNSIGEPRLESTRNITQGIIQDSIAEKIDRHSGHRIPTTGSTWLRPQGPGRSKAVTERAAIKTEPADSGDGLTGQLSRIGQARPSFNTEPGVESSCDAPQGSGCTRRAMVPDDVSVNKQCDGTVVPTLTLSSLPFTYLCLLQDQSSEPHRHARVIRIKAFIVTLLGKLTGKDGEWRVGATITDGTGYLDVALSDAVLTGLLGFSVAEKGVLRRDPARRGELDSGMKRCQEELVDMCCAMTIRVEPRGEKAVVTSADPLTEEDILALEERVKERRK